MAEKYCSLICNDKNIVPTKNKLKITDYKRSKQDQKVEGSLWRALK
jgi:hypothetical protein